MKSNTRIFMALSHVGKSDESIHVWHGTFPEVLMELAKYCGRTYMATRFDMCMARSKEEARKGLMIGKRKDKVAMEMSLESLEQLMDQAANSASSEATISSKIEQLGDK